MHVFGAFELEVRPGTPDLPAAVKIALLRYTRGEDGRLFITPECASFEEIEGQINSLQDELDELREKGPPSVPGCIVRGFSSSPASVSSRANPLEIAG
jgi:hypothetical protein